MKNKHLIFVIAFIVIFSVVLIKSHFSCEAEDAQDRKIPEETTQAIIETKEIVEITKEDTEEKPKYDFSDLSNWNLTVSAWEQLAEKNYEGVFVYANKCLELYEEEAKKQAKEMRRFAGLGHEDDHAVVNDVATCHYIMGEAYMREGKFDEAIKEFNIPIKEYPFAQCWDPKGWFWKVKEVSEKNLQKIEKLKQEKKK